MDPTSGAASAIAEVTYPNIYEGLVRLTRDGTVKPFLAQSWTISPDGLTYTFHLRKNMHFQNGVPFSAGIAKFSLDRARATNSVNPQKPALGSVKIIDVIDPYTLRITLSQPDSFLLSYLGWPAFVMVEPHSVATDRAPILSARGHSASANGGAGIPLRWSTIRIIGARKRGCRAPRSSSSPIRPPPSPP